MSVNTYKPVLCSSVVQINFVNNYFIWLVTYSSYCIVWIRYFEKKIHLNLTQKIQLQINLEKNAPVNHFKESNITL